MAKVRGSVVQRHVANELARHARGMLSMERSSFAPFDKEKDAEIHEAIRLYVETWVAPYAEALAASLADGSDVPLADLAYPYGVARDGSTYMAR
jgi:hypothetical protein